MDKNKKNNSEDIKKKIFFGIHYLLFAVILTMAVFAFCGDDMSRTVNKIMLLIVYVVLARCLWNVDRSKTAKRLLKSSVFTVIAAGIAYWLAYMALPGASTMVKGILLSVLLLISFML